MYRIVCSCIFFFSFLFCYINAELMSAGVANEVYLVQSSAEKSHILKIFHRKSLKELQQSEKLLQIVRKQGFHIPESIIPPTQIGQNVISVLSYVKGEHIRDENLPEVARLMARLHCIKRPNQISVTKKDFGPLFESCKDWKYCAELKKMYDAWDLSYLDDLPKGLIHGDFSYTNLLVDEKKCLTLIDFDHVREDLLLTDLVRCHLFYGFDNEGNFKEETVRDFVKAYHAIRPLKAVEIDVFYTHMKLCLLDVALEMYNHMYIKKDLCIDRVEGSSENACLSPNLIAKKILSIRDKRSFVFDQDAVPIFFFGLSGVGKTTMIQLLNKVSDLFYIPKFTVTRPKREDDDPRYFEYVSVEEFLQAQERKEFFLSMDEQGSYYGYKWVNLIHPHKHALLNASAHCIEAVNTLSGIKILIEGDAKKGLELRKNFQVALIRGQANKIIQEKFFSQPEFLRKMDVVFYNEFGCPEKSAKKLQEKIFEEIDHAN